MIPRLSLILPGHNGMPFIAQSITTVLEQSFARRAKTRQKVFSVIAARCLAADGLLKGAAHKAGATRAK